MASRISNLSAGKSKKANTLGKFLSKQDQTENAAARQSISARVTPAAAAPKPSSLNRSRQQLSKAALDELEKTNSSALLRPLDGCSTTKALLRPLDGRSTTKAILKPLDGFSTAKGLQKETCGASDMSTMADSNDAADVKRPKRMAVSSSLAHDQPVVPVLPCDRPREHGTSATQREASARLLEQKELDSSLLPMVGLCGGTQAGSAAANAARRSATPARPMRTAFTDRTLRLREGAQSRAALDLGASFSKGMTGHGNCNCPTCKPFELRAAGQVSSLFTKNVLSTCHQAPENTAGAVADSATYNSGMVGSLISSASQGIEQASLRKSMGRKMRVQRSFSCDLIPAAGQYHEPGFFAEANDTIRDRQLRARQPAMSQTRSQGAMTIAPRPEDPPASPRITDSKKGFVDPSSVISQEATRQSVRWNQTLYRFELKATDELSCSSRRSQSVPPERNANPITWQGSEEQTRSIVNSRFNSKSRNDQDSSSGTLRAMNFELVAQEQRQERTMRLSQEPRFAALCQVTQELSKTASLNCSTNGLKYGNASRGVRASLCWQA